ncbi:uncharacterized protein KQ657_004741 [Scheffersomyces spartinae]|uniref:1,3-beta-glucan synthase n=1 Tax=Scheffersomyces spartinae TaxID=45513 RepID=A0A9P7VBL2_9ASCO|nr:uncharacterized protein KQ657_004741 [Scheffersomyces spartinae]KAG7194526.1 hypothetical protein KQ657_004741 [Scheffersomyces spartinae]
MANTFALMVACEIMKHGSMVLNLAFETEVDKLLFRKQPPEPFFVLAAIKKQTMEQPPNTKEETMDDLPSSDSIASNDKALYPNWCHRNQAPISAEAIKTQFENLARRFQFQHSNVENMHEYLMCQLNSRASRTSCQQALLSIHRDYIGGDNANYKRWYFAVWSALETNYSVKDWTEYKSFKNLQTRLGAVIAATAPVEEERPQSKCSDIFSEVLDGGTCNPLLQLEYKWKFDLYNASEIEYIQQIALYLMIWGEANNVRFLPEGICFIFKICWDHWKSENKKGILLPINYFLDQVITPLYQYIRSQKYQKTTSGVWKRRNLRHDKIISYDDMNQFFWHPDLIRNIKLKNGDILYNVSKEVRFLHLHLIDWDKCFFKTYREVRSWNHLITNFGRVWIIHITMFWFFTAYNLPTLYTVNYSQLLNNPPPPQVQLSMVALAGVIPPIMTIWGIFFEFTFIPMRFPGTLASTLGRLFYCVVILLINLGPGVYTLWFIPLTVYSIHGYWISVVQFFTAVATLVYFAITPPAKLFGSLLRQNMNSNRTNEFAATFAPLDRKGQINSLILWICVFGAKFTESYFFLTLSFRDPIRVVAIMATNRCHSDSLISTKWLCANQPKIILVLLILTDFVLFFLDTYLWYIICNCLFSILLSLHLGISVLTPWRNIFLRLPERILSKIVYKKAPGSPASLISLIWNAIIISMFREHLLSVEQTRKLLFIDLSDGNIRPPVFFVFQDDASFSLKDFFVCGKEAERRITFLAHSISTSIEEPLPVKALPMFTVLVPHYSEKIILSLKEILKQPHQSRISLLEYLKQLHREEWNVFVKDSKTLHKFGEGDFEESHEANSYNDIAKLPDTEGRDIYASVGSGKEDLSQFMQNEINDIPYYCVGFKDSDSFKPLRTRIWASLRCQTLYRTISGFTNYQTALKILYQAENKEEIQYLLAEEVEEHLDQFSRTKFQLLVSMQKFQSFNETELEDAKSLFQAFPLLKACYLEEEKMSVEESTYYSTLLDTSRVNEEGNYGVKYRIKLSGNPILGDGKADNQNNAIIFSRGEYLQTIDANQDNYLEECLKIKSVLAEFEELRIDALVEYLPGSIGCVEQSQVAIVGAREYIYSENIGVLGDVAAAKEQTFGTLFARTLAAIGAKLHYGHPDFLNLIFMTTRGGISKATRELHLNEDIYAGMNAISRGESMEKGIKRTATRIWKHLVSLTPLFEVFVCNIYAESLRRNITYGGATYIPTGRGFAIIVPPILDAQFKLVDKTKVRLGPQISTLVFQPVGQNYNDTGSNAPLNIPRQKPSYTMTTIR